MDLKDLKCVVAIAEMGSFIRASERLNMSQPSVSARIRTLEAKFGVQLFTRNARGIQITQEGEDLLRHAQLILRQVKNAEADMTAYRSSPVGLVLVGLPTSLTARLSAPLLERCMAEMPHVKLRIVESMSGYITRWLCDEVLDIGITFGSSAPPNIDAEPLAREDLLLVAKSASDLASLTDEDGEVPFTRLSDVQLILPGPEHGLRTLIEGQARQQAVDIRVVVEIDSFGEIKRLVSMGFGYTIMSSAAFYYGFGPDLSAATIGKPAISRVVNLAMLAGGGQSRATKEVARCLRETIRTKTDGEKWFARAIE